MIVATATEIIESEWEFLVTDNTCVLYGIACLHLQLVHFAPAGDFDRESDHIGFPVSRQYQYSPAASAVCDIARHLVVRERS